MQRNVHFNSFKPELEKKLWGKYVILSDIEKRGTLMKADQSLDKNEKSLQELLFHSPDFKSSDFVSDDRHFRLFYLDTMIDLAVV